MENRDGYSRDQRIARLSVPGKFRMIDNDKASMLQHLLKIAGWIRFYNEREIPEAYFDTLLKDIAIALQATGRKHSFDPDGRMEPSQALLLAFIENLQSVTDIYNDRWNNFADWYLNDYLKVQPLPVKGDKVWLSFGKNVPEEITLDKGTGFVLRSSDHHEFIYRLEQEIEVQNIEVAKAFSICFERNPYHFPAARLNYVTVIKTRDLLSDRPADRVLMFDDQQNSRENKAIGVRITSPSLLLREGKRIVTICFESENNKWHEKLERAEQLLKEREKSAELVSHKLFSNLFYLTISTPSGWEQIKVYEVREIEEENKLILKFLLPEEFSPTSPCNQEIHRYTSEFPALQVRLNFDAWLYAYSWISEFIIQRISISTKVEGLTDLQIYNDLGKTDNSKSFPPFGIKTGTGSWMAVGSYEMAIKNTTSANIRLKWGQLPLHPKGLKGHYAAYPGNIRNDSFKISARYLSDNKWKPAAPSLYRLFEDAAPEEADYISTDPPISDELHIDGLILRKMSPVEIPEENYELTTKSRSGFIRFTLEEPEMGFGEQEYRDLFTQRMMMKKWRRKNLPVLHPPITPVVEHISLDYTSEDVLDLRRNTEGSKTTVDQLYPFGTFSSMNKKTNAGIPFVFSQRGDASIMFGLKNVQGGESFSVFLLFEALSNELSIDDVPQIEMFWGDGYNWEELPRGFISRDDTRQMLMSGNIVFNFPQHISPLLYDDHGILWIRAAILNNHGSIPELKAIYRNAGQVVLETENGSKEKWQSFKHITGALEPERKIPGLGELKQITSFYSGQELEDLKNMQVRVSEFVTHRGRAITARDYELLVLQEFPDIGKVLCLPGINLKNDDKNVVTVVVLPGHPMGTRDLSKPLVPTPLLAFIEDFLQPRAAAGAAVDVVNPVYEELLVKCVIRIKKDVRLIPVESLMEIFDNFIAPWQKKNILPTFGQPVNLSHIYDALKETDFIEAIDYFGMIRVSQKNTLLGARKHYDLHEYFEENHLLYPDKPYKLFVPAEHLIEVIDHEGNRISYGVGDMEIGKTFILDKS